VYLGSTTVLTDASGNASFTFVAAGAGAGAAGYFTATATNTATQDTGEFSPALVGGASTPEAPGLQATQLAFAPSQVGGRLSLAGQVIDRGGDGAAGVRISLHQTTGGEICSRDWDPNRLQVALTDALGGFRFGNLGRGRYQALAYAPGFYFTPRARWVEVGSQFAAEANFTLAGRDAERPEVNLATVTPDSHGRLVVRGSVSDAGGAGVRAVLVRLRAVERDPSLSPQWLDWRTGAWESTPAPSQTRWAVLDALGEAWSQELPPLGAGQYQLEVEALDWAGNRSTPLARWFRGG
jgi:hypothetical protein